MKKNYPEITLSFFAGRSVFNNFNKLFNFNKLSHHFDKVSQTIFFRKCILASESKQKSHIPTVN